MLFKKQTFLPAFEFQSGKKSKFSALKLNEEKTEFFRLGVHNLCEWFPHEFKLSIQILGVHFDCDELPRKKANF